MKEQKKRNYPSPGAYTLRHTAVEERVLNPPKSTTD